MLATVTDDAIPVEYVISIEGIRRRYGTTSPSWAPTADTGDNRIVRPYMTEFPSISGFEAEPLDGKSSSMEFEVSLLDVDDELTDLFSINKAGNETLVNEAAEVAFNDTGLTVDDASIYSIGDHIYVNDETMKITNIVGNNLAVTRGMFDSIAKAIPVTDSQGNDLEVIVSDRPRFMMTREVLLYQYKQGLTSSDFVLIRGWIEDYSESNGVWTIKCPGWLKRLDVTIGEKTPTATMRGHLWGGHISSNGNAYYEAGDDTGSSDIAPYTICNTAYIEITKETDYDEFAATGSIVIDNEIIEYQSKEEDKTKPWYSGYFHLTSNGSVGGNRPVGYKELGPLITANRGKLSHDVLGQAGWRYIKLPTPISVGNGTSTISSIYKPWFMSGHADGSQIKQVIGKSSFETGSLTADPVSIFLQLILSGDDDNASAYNALPDGWGAAVPEGRVDITACEELRERYYKSVAVDNFYITEPTELMEWMAESFLRPNLLFPVETPEGKISLARLYTEAEASRQTGLTTIDEDVLVELPEFSPGKPPIGKMEININYYPPEDEYYLKYNVVLGSAVQQYKGLSRNVEIDCPVAYDPSGAGNRQLINTELGTCPQLIRNLLAAVWDRFAEKPCPVLNIVVPYNRFIDIEAGDVVKITCSVTPNVKDAVRGLSNDYFQVIGVEPSPESSSCNLKLWQIGVHDKNYNRIAPAGKITVYDAGPPVNITIAANEFTASGGSPYSADVDAFDIADLVTIVTSEYVPKHGGVYEARTIGGISGNVITLTVAPSTAPAPGDYIIFAKYDDCVNTQQTEYAYLADATPALGAADDDPNVRL
jgi:hypothetical protein